jgi:hypothetical protein
MNRKDFFKKLGFGALAVAIAPKVLAEAVKETPKVKDRSLMTPHEYHLDNCKMVKNNPKDVLKYYQQSGNLLYTEDDLRINDIVSINIYENKYVVMYRFEGGGYALQKI